jgi:hypothetical protein
VRGWRWDGGGGGGHDFIRKMKEERGGEKGGELWYRYGGRKMEERNKLKERLDVGVVGKEKKGRGHDCIGGVGIEDSDGVGRERGVCGCEMVGVVGWLLGGGMLVKTVKMGMMMRGRDDVC